MSRKVNDPYMSHYDKISGFPVSEGPRRYVCTFNDTIRFTLSRLVHKKINGRLVSIATKPEEDIKTKREMKSHVNYCTAEIEVIHQNQEIAVMEAD